MDEIGGGLESANVTGEQEGEVDMEEKEGGEEEELQAGAEENTPEEKNHQSEPNQTPKKSNSKKKKKTREKSPVCLLLSPSANRGGGNVIAIRPRPLSSLSFGRVSIVMTGKVYEIKKLTEFTISARNYNIC